MSIELTFQQPYLSIVTLPTVTLPPFTLITGLNGSGKTHLLQAIAHKCVAIEGVQNASQEVRYFDWNSFVPGGQGTFQSAQLDQERQEIFQQLDSIFAQKKNIIISAARDAELPGELLAHPKKIAKLSIDELETILGDPEKAQAAYQSIRQATTDVSNMMRGQLRQNPMHLQLVEAFVEASELPLASYDKDTFVQKAPVAWGHADFFQRSFGRLFVAYRDLLVRNKLQVLAKQEGDHNAQPLSNEEFEQKHNIPPWVFLNTTLADAGLDFEINLPDLYALGSYQPKLRKKSSGVEIDFGGLSSGEKVLMSFANCLYYASDSRQISFFPKVLLLDEVDAPLHPSMTRTFIRAITDTLVGRFNIPVIATTHSPSTVAMAPEEAVYVMKEDVPGVHKVSKGEALTLLTTGVPTLSISFSGRRQVFVESETDSRVYDRVYQLAKPYLKSERSLTFLSPGTRERAGDVNTGCAQVQRIVGMLSESGNQSILGLIDWDGKNNPSERVKVLAHGVRNGIENCIFDPLILACLIARDARDRRHSIGLPEEGGTYDLKQFAADKLQATIDSVQSLVLGAEYDAGSPSVECGYAGGLMLKVKQSFLTLDDHQLEAKIFSAIPPLQKFEQRSGHLLTHTVENLLPDFPEFIPMDVIDAFSKLLAIEL